MKTKTSLTLNPLLAILIAAFSLQPSALLLAAPMGTAFTYQGRLDIGTNAANGSFDLVFTLYDALAGGDVVITPVTNPAVAISSGLFTAVLDFGSDAFPGETRWLEMAVRTNGSGAFTTLAPR